MIKLFNSLLLVVLFFASKNSEILQLTVLEFPISFIYLMVPFWFSFILITACVEFIIIVLVLLLVGRKFFIKKYSQFFLFCWETFPNVVYDYARSAYRDFMLKNRYPFIDKSISEQYIAKKQILFYFWCYRNMIFEDLNLLLNRQAFIFSMRFLITILYDLILFIGFIISVSFHIVKYLVIFGFSIGIYCLDFILKVLLSPWNSIVLFNLIKGTLSNKDNLSFLESLNAKLYLMDLKSKK